MRFARRFRARCGSTASSCPAVTSGNCDVVRSLDGVFGLDQEAIKAAKQWRFSPGMKQGVAVPVLVTISMGFTLR